MTTSTLAPSPSRFVDGAGLTRVLEAVPVRVHSRDPISELGILAQLRQRPELRVVQGPEQQPGTVVLAIADTVDDEVTRWLRTLHRAAGAPIVLVIGELDPRAVTDVVCSGVRGVARRTDATPELLVRLVQSAARGNGDLPPELLSQLLDQVNRLNNHLLEPRGLHVNGLTDRERDILRLIADGLSTREVATRLAYSERTIKAGLQSLTARLQMRNRTQAVAYAVRNGWI